MRLAKFKSHKEIYKMLVEYKKIWIVNICKK
jgi:hypothetical protein